MKFIFTVFFLFLIILLQNETLAQEQIWEVYPTSNESLINVTVNKYESDSLYIKSLNQLIILHQDSIKYLIKRRDSQFWVGFLFGAIIGGIVGAAATPEPDTNSSGTGKGLNIFFGAALGGLIGGFFGSSVGSDEKYQLEKLQPDHKRAILNSLFNEH